MNGHVAEQLKSAQPQAPSYAAVASAPAQYSTPTALSGSRTPLRMPQWAYAKPSGVGKVRSSHSKSGHALALVRRPSQYMR